MIEIKNLHKTYNQNKKNECKALKGVSFSLPDSGMIFVVGKSGSGKSTLLNLLGGLDSPTSGEIIFNGNDISKFSESQLEIYRNFNVGFIFQDFCLIESMSVYDNIKLALDLQNKQDNLLIEDTIKSVGLDNKQNTPVNLLSGGQKQRVAIARALVKAPSIILADEPTGNLDSKTSLKIFSILKDLSKDNLIVVISHNLDDAYKYADRIIEISDGKIIDDLDKVTTKENNNIAILTPTNSITDNELEDINKKLKKHKLSVVRKNANFITHSNIVNIKQKNLNTLPGNNKFSFNSKFKLFKQFFKKKIFGIISMILLTSLLLSLIGLCQSFNYINQSSIISEAIDNDTAPLIFRKGIYDEYEDKINDNFLGIVTDEDIKSFGYNGDAFKLYRYPIPIVGNYDNICFGRKSGFGFRDGIYLKSNGFGVLQCTEEYLTKIYGTNGKLEVLSGNFTKSDNGIIVTDYFADSLLLANKDLISTSSDKYENLTNSSGPILRRYKINAVISTNYLEKYSWLIEQINLATTYPSEAKKLFNELRNNDLTYQFIQEVNNYLAIAYSFNENFIMDSIDNPKDNCYIHYFENIEITDTSNKVLRSNEYQYIVTDGNDITGGIELGIKDNEIYFSAELYNDIFNTTLTFEDQTGFEEKDIFINLYSSSRKYEDLPKVTKKLTIKGIIPHESIYASAVSENTFKELRAIDMSAYALYFDGGTNNDVLYNKAENLFYEGSSYYIETVQSICKTLSIFKDIFVILLLGLVLISIFVLSSYVTRNIFSYKRELGIFRAIGAKNKDAASPFIILSIIIGIASAILSTSGFYFICLLTNSLLAKGFAINLEMPILSSLNLIKFNPLILLIDLLILFIVIAVCSYTPIITMKKIKPIDIMRKE